jgi:hypothetical protein
MATRLSRSCAVVCAISFVVACSDGRHTAPQAGQRPTAADTSRVPAVVDGTITVDGASTGTPFDRRLLGTNAPAWIRPEVLGDPAFQQQVRNLGASVVRMPGGSWSSSYDWLACEQRNADGCFWTWASRPSDFVGFLAATGIQGMWTANINGTAQEAAALVAFFNGSTTDERVIGTDRNGFDWGTVGRWASLRAQNGHPTPQPITYWEVGNELYGGRADNGKDCAAFGWEDGWTCDGTEYVNGVDGHDGFLQFRKAMQAVDPSIEVGAVGISGYQSDWTGFGYEVIQAARDQLDFYVVHDYGFDSRPDISAVLRRPASAWPEAMGSVSSVLHDEIPDRDVPVAVTEYNMFSFADGDTSGMMGEAIDAFYIADTIGQMAINGVSMANQWNLVNGLTDSGSDYGLLDGDTYAPRAQFYGLAMWGGFGDTLLPCSVGFDTANDLMSYCGRRSDGALTLLVLNKAASVTRAQIAVSGATVEYEVVADAATAGALDATTMNYDDLGPVADLASHRGKAVGMTSAGTLTISFDPYSITLVTMTAASQDPALVTQP